MPEYLHISNDKPSLLIKVVGDICPGDQAIPGLGTLSLSQKYGADFPFNHISGLFQDADIVIGNLEGMLSESVSNLSISSRRFCGLPKFAEVLGSEGFNVINVANNHILDNGPELFFETVEILRKTGIKICGLRGNNGYYSQPVIINKKEKKVGIISYNWIVDGKPPEIDNYIAQSHDSVVNYTWHRNPEQDKENQNNYNQKNKNVIRDIKNLKRKVDTVVLICHWAYEFVNYPPYGVTLEARSFIDAGADLIIGIHPHCLHGYEQYRSKNIYYSLGNFIFDTLRKESKKTAVLNCQIVNSNEINCSMQYLMINKRHQPTPADVLEEKKIHQLITYSNSMIDSPHISKLLNDDKVYHEFEQMYNRGKIKSILYHFILMTIHPAILKVIYLKFLNFINVIKLRLMGKKIRW